MADNDYAEWSQENWRRIKLGGVWIVPRSGLTFRKTANGYNLVDIAYSGNEAFTSFQREDFACVKNYSAKAGLTVTDSSNLLGA